MQFFFQRLHKGAEHVQQHALAAAPYGVEHVVRIHQDAEHDGRLIKDGPLTIHATVENDERPRRILNVYPISNDIGRLSRSEDISALVAFLASERALFITGQTIGASGGFAML